MNDQNQNGAIRLQSSAIVVAALITTSGAVIAACIQTGLIGRLSDPELAVSMVAPSPAPKPVQATFTGAIEPLVENRGGQLQQVGGQVQRVSATVADKIVVESPPALLPSEEIARPEGTIKTLVSPWAYLRGSTSVEAPGDAAKPKKKPFDWNTVTRYFRGNN